MPEKELLLLFGEALEKDFGSLINTRSYTVEKWFCLFSEALKKGFSNLLLTRRHVGRQQMVVVLLRKLNSCGKLRILINPLSNDFKPF